MVTAHAGSRDVRAWSTLRGALSDKPLSPKLETIVVTVCVSELEFCYNLQSVWRLVSKIEIEIL